MAQISESAYRKARRAFIAACEAAHVDAVARLHPARDKDGNPLFMDAAALGPRRAARAVLVVGRGARGSAVVTQLLCDGLRPADGTRVVLVHALDPAIFAGVKADANWPAAMLGAVATEDLSRVHELGVLPLEDGADLMPALSASLPKAAITLLARTGSSAAAKAAIEAFLAK